FDQWVSVVHGGHQQLQRAASGSDKTIEQRSALSGQLHVFEKPGRRLRHCQQPVSESEPVGDGSAPPLAGLWPLRSGLPPPGNWQLQLWTTVRERQALWQR